MCKSRFWPGEEDAFPGHSRPTPEQERLRKLERENVILHQEREVLKMAIRRLRPGAGLIHHSDEGSPYTDGTHQSLLRDHGIQASMNGVGSWYDNAPTESFFGTLKSELVHHRVYHIIRRSKGD